MSGDYSRFTFDPFEDHFGVLMQQGRVMLDSDFNEWVEVFERQFRVRTLDTVGRCVVPRETPAGFQIQISGSTLTIGRGRAYVHGLLVENHGGNADGRPVSKLDAGALEYDPVLEEQRGLHPVAFEHQPYLPNAATFLPPDGQGGPLVVYLDVWQREVTYLQEPDLVEKAVGVDTTTRNQVVWQVKILPTRPGTTCSSEIPGWDALTAPPAGRLTTNAVGVPASDDPCILSPSGGYRGTENRLYRVEVHQGGPAATATFKWSRDNASVKAGVSGINAGLDVLTVTRIGRDSVRRFAPNDWLEIIDDHLELTQQPGTLRKVLSVDEVNQTITLDAALPAGVFDEVDPASRHTRIVRWDQRGPVFDAASTVIDDVDTNDGVIRVAAGGGTIVLEDGVEVTFSEDPAGGAYRTGDYWVFAARTVDASVERLVQAPPRGIIHHYCRLAVVDFPGQPTDCRVFWPPEFGERGCDCSECVSAESHNSGAFTIQMAIDRVSARGGKVCLGPGVFVLGEAPVLVSGARSVQVEGHGFGTILLYLGAEAAVRVSNSIGVELSRFSVFALDVGGDHGSFALAVIGSTLTRVERCALAQFGARAGGGAAVGLSGLLIETTFSDNILFGAAGLQTLTARLDDDPDIDDFAEPNATAEAAVVPGQRTFVLSFGLYIEDNFIVGIRRGISLDGLTQHLGDTRISGNRVFGAREVGILSGGNVLEVLNASRVDIIGNYLTTFGVGIAFATDNTRVCENDLGVFARPDNQDSSPRNHGILLSDGLFSKEIARAQILSNRITGLGGDAIRILANVASAMIKQNFIENVGNGVVMLDRASAGTIVVENNQLREIGRFRSENDRTTAIRIQRANQATLGDNRIEGIALEAAGQPSRAAVLVLASTMVRITGNVVTRVASQPFAGGGAGIEVWAPFHSVEISQNTVRRSEDAGDDEASKWHGIFVGGRVRTPTNVATGEVESVAMVLLSPDDPESDLLTIGASFLARKRFEANSVAVRGNFVEAHGGAPAVELSARTSILFSDNHCALRTTAQTASPTVVINAASSVTSNNHVDRVPRVDLGVSLDITSSRTSFTVLGNLCTGGKIHVNSSVLAPPWAPLNVTEP